MELFYFNSDMFVIFYILLMTIKHACFLCDSTHGKTCCAGTYWNEEKSTCQKCQLGYHGINCSDMCSFPSYGRNCQGTCNCSLILCDHRSGCKIQYDNTGYTTTHRRNVTLINYDLTTPKLSGKASLEKPYILYIVYTTSAIVGMFAISFCVFIGIHFYKKCSKKVRIPEGKEDADVSNARIGYSSLFVDSQQHFSDPTYLEPVFCSRGNDVEIMDQDETGVPSINENTNVKTSNSPNADSYSRSPHVPLTVEENMVQCSEN